MRAATVRTVSLSAFRCEISTASNAACVPFLNVVNRCLGCKAPISCAPAMVLNSHHVKRLGDGSVRGPNYADERTLDDRGGPDFDSSVRPGASGAACARAVPRGRGGRTPRVSAVFTRARMEGYDGAQGGYHLSAA